MAIAHDAVSNVAQGTGNLSWTHTPTGTPRGVVVQVIQYHNTAAVSDEISGVTYGGDAMTEVAESPVIHTGNVDFSAIHTYFLGTSIPTGAQTVVVTVTGSTAKRAVAATMTAAADTEVNDTGTVDTGTGATITNPSISLSTTEETVCYAALMCGVTDAANVVSDQTNILEHDFQNDIGSWDRTDAVAAGTITFNWTTNTAEQAGHAVAINEIVSGAVEVNLGQNTETDTAQAMSVGKSIALGATSETDAAQAITLRKNVALGLASETDTAQAFTVDKTIALGIASEADTALGITPRISVPLGLAQETDAALGLTVRKTVALGIAEETDTALPLTVDDGSEPEAGASSLALLHAGK
jgi:hypothetical protein